MDVAFIGCDGISLKHGLSTPYRAEAAVKRSMIAAARRSVALVDHSKFGNDQLIKFVACSDIDMIITDRAIDDETASAYEAVGPAVQRA